ncbi:MAG TPA: SPFH domain-containing protein [Thermoanaerobaculia bacterium]|nr:SPFH domain-containing protein [Thermoanaerobaculia bacterium]
MKTIIVAAAFALAGCSSENVPQAHKGRMFDKTGALAFYSGGRGFEGPVLNPGTYYTGIYPEIRMVDCSRRTIKEPLNALAKDNIQFSLDIYVSYSANCDDDAVIKWLLSDLAPLGASAQVAEQEKEKNIPTEEKDPVEQNPDLTITSRQIYNIYIRPALGEAVRRTVSEYNANDINQKREEMFKKITDGFNADLAKGASKKDDSDPKAPKSVVLVTVYSINISNFAFPKEMADANTDRATQAVLRDTAIAAREKVKAETETAALKVTQTETEAKAEAAKIDVIGAALHRNPEYYVRDVYYYAAEKGGSVMVPQNPSVILQLTPKKP